MISSSEARKKAVPWPLLKQIATLVLFSAVVVMLALNAHKVDWGAVLSALRDYPPSVLAVAVLLTLCSFGVYSCFDLLARPLTREHMSARAVMAVTFVSHALGLNLGVAGVALRFRLYGSYGVASTSVARVWGLSILTNWLGFLLLGGVVFAWQLIDLPQTALLGSRVSEDAFIVLGSGLLLAAGSYLAGCAAARGRRFTLFGQQLCVPGFRFAAGQIVLSCVNWMLIAAVMYVLLREHVDYPTVLGVYLLSAIALSVVDVPGGLGVTEAVFLTLLGSRVPIPELLAALVVYRAVFYLAPALPALLSYLAIEARQRAPGAKPRGR